MPRVNRLDDVYGQTAPTIDGPLFKADPFARSKSTPTPVEHLVAEAIWEARPANPVTTEQLLEKLSENNVRCDRRVLEAIIERLRTIHKIPIGSKRSEPSGYFIMRTPEEWALGTAHYRRQLISGWRTLRAMELPRTMLLELLGQLKLED